MVPRCASANTSPLRDLRRSGEWCSTRPVPCPYRRGARHDRGPAASRPRYHGERAPPAPIRLIPVPCDAPIRLSHGPGDALPVYQSDLHGGRARSAASSASGRPVIRSPASRTSGSTPSSTAARSRPASRSATASRLALHKRLGLVSGVFDEETLLRLEDGDDAATAARLHRSHAVQHHRVEHAAQRPAGLRRVRSRRADARAQRQPHQRALAARRADRAGRRVRVRVGHRGARQAHRPCAGTDMGAARRPRLSSRQWARSRSRC